MKEKIQKTNTSAPKGSHHRLDVRSTPNLIDVLSALLFDVEGNLPVDVKHNTLACNYFMALARRFH